MAKLVLCLFSLTWELKTGGLLRGWIFSHTPLENVLSLERFVSRRGLKASCEALHVMCVLGSLQFLYRSRAEVLVKWKMVSILTKLF